MSIKSKGRTLGRMIRRLTGLPLPICMKVGKMAAQEREYDIVRKYPDVVTSELFQCNPRGQSCCSYTIFRITGPKGVLECEYSLDAYRITKEYNITMGLRNNPGKAVDNEGRVVG